MLGGDHWIVTYSNYPLVMTNIAIENGDVPIKNGDFPMKNGGSFHSYVNVYQRVSI